MKLEERLVRYWQENRTLMTIVLIIWALVSIGASIISNSLNSIVIFGFPLGYYMGAQGSLIVFILLIVTYSNRMDALDEKYDFKEE